MATPSDDVAKAEPLSDLSVEVKHKLTPSEASLLLIVYEEIGKVEKEVEVAEGMIRQAQQVLEKAIETVTQLTGARNELIAVWQRQVAAVLACHGLNPVEKDGTGYIVDPERQEIRVDLKR